MTNIAKHWFLIFIIIKSQAAFTGGRNSNATPAQSPVVVRNPVSTQKNFRLLLIEFDKKKTYIYNMDTTLQKATDISPPVYISLSPFII